MIKGFFELVAMLMDCLTSRPQPPIIRFVSDEERGSLVRVGTVDNLRSATTLQRSSVPVVKDISLPVPEIASSLLPASTNSFLSWRKQWDDLMEYSGPEVPDARERIEQLLHLWRISPPDGWQRGVDPQLLGKRYRRGDFQNPQAGEHTIEFEILQRHFEEVDFLGYHLVDGINAVPLSRDPQGGRRGNVEADMVLLLEKNGQYVMAVCEVKATANNAWFAAVENLRQLRLFSVSESARSLFHQRNQQLTLPSTLPFIACVIAPEEFYCHVGQKNNARLEVIRLLDRFAIMTGYTALLTVLDSSHKRVKMLE
ncbi:MAG: hypothetical protein HQM06_16430 [Magnetococcales bacterium]|nr:hypothetical protein [Magnetococcales bacterium]